VKNGIYACLVKIYAFVIETFHVTLVYVKFDISLPHFKSKIYAK